MIKLTISRPNTIGDTFEHVYDTYPEDFIEKRCEKLADKGWEVSELPGSTTKSGCIEATHDYEADILLIQWVTVNE